MLFPVLSALLSFQDDAELIQRLKRHEPEAMGEMYDRYARAAYSLMVRMVRDSAIAEDLLQETFLKIWNRIDGFDEAKGLLGPWVLTVTRHRAIDYLRSTEGRVQPVSGDLEKLERPKFFLGFEADYANRERIRVIRDAFQKLSENQRRVVELAYFEGLSQSEMATRLQQPLVTMKTLARTALQALRQELSVAFSNS